MFPEEGDADDQKGNRKDDPDDAQSKTSGWGQHPSRNDRPNDGCNNNKKNRQHGYISYALKAKNFGSLSLVETVWRCQSPFCLLFVFEGFGDSFAHTEPRGGRRGTRRLRPRPGWQAGCSLEQLLVIKAGDVTG